ncbi:acyl-CoA dehydrogenase [Ramlibacter sp. MAHUQ-53]|uniref:acyl-CoA dehydrogenase n=1 Tax=unclassified Ramlibacter TaxID=2617605 RepID=UPI0036289060
MILSPDDAQCLREAAADGDARGELAAATRDLIARRDWMRLLVPRAAGGAELDLPAVVRLEEALAEADGSCAWVVTLCAGAGWFLGFLPPSLAAQVAATPGCCLGGSGAAAGFADREGAGWRVSGQWPVATGATLATHFTFNAVLREGGRPLLDAQGAPRVSAFVVPARDVRVQRGWRAIGLRASGSHGFAIESAWVPQAHAFTVAAGPVVPGPLYRFPFASLAYATLAANVGGLARGFLQRAAPLLAHRAAQGRSDAREARAALEAARGRCLAVLEAQWDRVAAGSGPCDEAALREASLAWAAAARAAVDAAYPLCGLRAADAASDLNRAWRDFHTGAQHAMLAP